MKKLLGVLLGWNRRCWRYPWEQILVTTPTPECLSTCCGWARLILSGEVGELIHCKGKETGSGSSRDGAELGKVPLPIDWF